MIPEKNPAIDALTPGSLCHTIYRELYAQFFNAQDRMDEEHPWGVEEGDETSVRLHNMAYGFASAVAGAVGGGDGDSDGGILLEYLRKSGGDMQGPLGACYGFAAGLDNRRIAEAFRDPLTDEAGNVTDYDYGLRITGGLHVDAAGLYVGGMQPLVCDPSSRTVYIREKTVDFSYASLRLRGEMLIGESESRGLHLSAQGLRVDGMAVYHGGNANRADASWTMRDATVAGDMAVSGSAELSGALRALHGAQLGTDGGTQLTFDEEGLTAFADLSLAPGCAVRFDGAAVLGRAGERDIRLSGSGGDLLLGGEHTERLRLLSGLMDANDSHMLLSPYGAACFPDSLTVRHDFGEVLLSSYRTDSEDEGITIHRRLRLGSPQGPYLCPKEGGIALCGTFGRTVSEEGRVERRPLSTTLRYLFSAEDTATDEEPAGILGIETGAAAVLFDKGVRTRESFEIAGSATRLAPGALFLSGEHFLRAAADGIRHSGNTYLTGDVSSELFTAGFAGRGWAVRTSRTTGNAAATFDELTVRKRMKVYQLEIRRTDVVGGGLWISHCCKGDTVERVY